MQQKERMGEEWRVDFLLPVEEEPEAQDVRDDHQQAIWFNKPEPPFRSINDAHQPDVHHDDRPKGRERMGGTHGAQ